jgi:hypothetical protein
MSPEELKAYWILQNAKKNAIAMFVFFLIGLAMFVAMAVAPMKDARFDPGFLSVGVFTSEVFAVVYLSVRWRTLTSLPKPFARLGIIGGIGLIVILALEVAAIAIGFAL